MWSILATWNLFLDQSNYVYVGFVQVLSIVVSDTVIVLNSFMFYAWAL